MEYKEDIEQLVKNTFDSFEADVHPDAWMNIQNGLNVPVSNPASIANHVSTGAKLAAVSSKYIIMSASAIIGITAAIVYFSPDNETVNPNPVNESKVVQNALPVTASTDNESKSFSGVDNVSKKEQPVSLNETLNIKNEKKESSSYASSTNEEVAVLAINKEEASEISAIKNKDEEVKMLSNLPIPAAGVDEKSKENRAEEESSSNQNPDESVNTIPPVVNEEKNIQGYLGEIFSTITPNGDGKNDAFIIEGKDLKTLKVSIIDRSGKIIHQWNNLHGFWDGRLENGQPAETGTYFYNIFAQTKTGTPLSKTGTLHLLLK